MKIFWCAYIFIFLTLFSQVQPSYADQNSLDLTGYVQVDGEITVLYKGDTVDPYFVTQSLLLAHEYGFDISQYRDKWLGWILKRQKLDGTFDRFCRAGPTWVNCKQADADDALLAMHMQLLETSSETLAKDPLWRTSYEASDAALEKLFDPAKGVYLVSPIFQHALFMDNLEIWHAQRSSIYQAKRAKAAKLALAIHRNFMVGDEKSFLVSTQPEQKTEKETFYPHAVAQIFPLLFKYKPLPDTASTFYTEWKKEHRHQWLTQIGSDFAWGLIAIVALRQNDTETAGCWLRDAGKYRHTSHWALTDEISYQILLKNRVPPSSMSTNCD